MFQCGVCEDWFHLQVFFSMSAFNLINLCHQHLGLPSTFKPDEYYEELTCSKCVGRLPLLWLYHYYAEKTSVEPSIEESINESTCETVEEPASKRTRLSDVGNEENKMECRLVHVLKSCNVETNHPPLNEMEKLVVNESKFPSPIFWSCDWRTSILCLCTSCKVSIRLSRCCYLL